MDYEENLPAQGYPIIKSKKRKTVKENEAV